MEKTKNRERNASLYLHRWFSLTLALIVAMSWTALSVYSGKPAAAAGRASVMINPVAVVVTSNITFDTTAIAPGSRLSAFGTFLATTSATPPPGPLPTELVGTFVEVNGVRQQILSITKFPGYDQVDFVLSSATAVGAAMISITSGDGTISQGTFQVRPFAPVIFFVNGDFNPPPPNAVLTRVKSNGTVSNEVPYQFNPATGSFITKPIDLTPAGDVVALTLFASGLGTGGVANVRVIIGGEVLTPSFAGPQGSPGLDQVNVTLPRSLIGAGLVSGVLTANGFASNAFELEFASEPISAFPTFSGFSPASVLAGATLTINGSGFDPQAADNEVHIAGLTANVVSATTTQLQVTVPFGTQSGNVRVRTPQGEGTSASAITLRTSISGIVQNTASEPLAGMTAQVSSSASMGISDATGNFILADVGGGAALVEINGATVPASPPYPLVVLKQIVSSGRDNQFSHPIYLQQATGPSANVGSGGEGGPGDDAEESDAPVSGPNAGAEALAAQNQRVTTLTNGSVTLEIQAGTRAQFPNGATNGDVTLTNVVGSRTPVPMPQGIFSTLVAQITEFGVKFTPGGTLIFNNADGLPAGSTATLWMLDQDRQSQTIGQFVAVGPAAVSADGKTIRSAPGAVKITSIYFVAVERPMTTITGRVVDCSGRPQAGATVNALGHSDITDATGSFVLGGVPVITPNTSVTVEASLVQDGQTFTARANIFIVPGGVTSVRPDLILFTPNCRPQAFSRSASTCQGRPVLIPLLASERSGIGPPSGFQPISIFPPPGLRYIINVQPRFGTVKGLSFSVLTFSPYVTYVPANSFVGTDTFVFSVINNLGIKSNLAFITIRVNNCAIP